MSRMHFLASFVCLGLLLGCSAESSYQVPPRQVPQELLRQLEQQQAGARLFARHCRECHGSLAEGRNPRAARFNPPAPDFFSHHFAELDPAYLYWRIAEGMRPEPFRSRGSVMPAWGPHLSEEQIWQLVAYLRQRSTGG